MCYILTPKEAKIAMAKAKYTFTERRRYTRLQTPINLSYALSDENRIYNAATKDISADGLRFETPVKTLQQSNVLELKLNIPGAPNPVHGRARVIWKKKISLEDRAPFHLGLEFIEIEEDNKNTFLKFLCDLIYNLPKEIEYAKRKS